MATERVVAGGLKVEVARLRITDAGRRVPVNIKRDIEPESTPPVNARTLWPGSPKQMALPPLRR